MGCSITSSISGGIEGGVTDFGGDLEVSGIGVWVCRGTEDPNTRSEDLRKPSRELASAIRIAPNESWEAVGLQQPGNWEAVFGEGDISQIAIPSAALRRARRSGKLRFTRQGRRIQGLL